MAVGNFKITYIAHTIFLLDYLDGVTEQIYFSILIEELNTSCAWPLVYKIPKTQHSIVIHAIANAVK